MMEQLAERRMQREEDAHYAASGMHPSYHPSNHNHGAPLPEDEEDYDEEDEEYDEDYDEEDEEDEMVIPRAISSIRTTNSQQDTMTEEQRMEEGRRMFQIFAARMFEQRVLQAYREKVAAERQQKLLEELEEEGQLDKQREAKRAREAQKKKEKKEKQKQAKAEEKARKDADEAEKLATLKAEEERKQEEQRRKKEEQRKKKDAERKAQEEEKLRKEADRLKRQQDERTRQQEAERKAKEAKAAEKAVKEEAKRKEREDREGREREAREKKAHDEKQRKDVETKVKLEKEAREKADREAKAAQNAQAAPQQPQIAKRPSQPAIPLPPGLHPKQSSGFSSPHVQVATPVISKTPTPNKPRQSSQQGSHGSSPKTPAIGVATSKSISPSNAATQQPSATVPKSILQKPQVSQPPQPTQPSQTMSPMHPMHPPPGMHPPAVFGAPPGMGFPNSQSPMMPGMAQRTPGPHNMPMFPPHGMNMGNQYRGFPPPNGMSMPPGIAPSMMPPIGRGFSPDPPPGFSQPIPGAGSTNHMPVYSAPREGVMPPSTHSRVNSIEKPGFESPNANVGPQTNPISRPAPIQRPSSVKPYEGNENRKSTNFDVDNLSNALGSSALLDDTDEPIPAPGAVDPRRQSLASGFPRSSGMAFGGGLPPPANQPPRGMEQYGLGLNPGGTWGSPNLPPFGAPNMNPGPNWGNSPNSGWSNGPFGMGMSQAQHRASVSRPVSVRLMVCEACRRLTASKAGTPDGFHEVGTIQQQIERIRNQNEVMVQTNEILDICETEGDAHNGGGNFTVKQDPANANRKLVKYDADGGMTGHGRPMSGLGEIGSPVPGHAIPGGFGNRGGFPGFSSL